MKNLQSGAFSDFDILCMSRAIALAKRGRGKTSPNPLVGAVIAKDGVVIGEGWHKRHGGPHAEARAIRDARAKGRNLRAAHLYCSLEPCCGTWEGKHREPCAPQIIKSGISRVVVANTDPNPKVNGAGLQLLRDAGIETESGLLEAEGRALNEGFFTFQKLGRPFVRLKIASSLDGKIAAQGGDSRWITDEAARKIVHRMRSRHDALLIGRGTALADDPELTVRLAKGPNPLRVVLDSRLSLPAHARLFALPDIEKTIIVHRAGADAPKAALLKGKGARLLPLEGDLSPEAVLKALAALGVRSVFVEGGSAVYTAFLKERLVDRVAVFIAPLIMGRALDAAGDLGTRAVADALRLCDVSIRRIGSQVLVEGSPFAGSGGV